MEVGTPPVFFPFDRTSAIAPVTCGAAMLVPSFTTTSVAVPPRAAQIATPGAATSGFSRLSRVGPSDENGPTRIGLAGSIAPTVITYSAVPGMLNVNLLD